MVQLAVSNHQSLTSVVHLVDYCLVVSTVQREAGKVHQQSTCSAEGHLTLIRAHAWLDLQMGPGLQQLCTDGVTVGAAGGALVKQGVLVAGSASFRGPQAQQLHALLAHCLALQDAMRDDAVEELLEASQALLHQPQVLPGSVLPALLAGGRPDRVSVSGRGLQGELLQLPLLLGFALTRALFLWFGGRLGGFLCTRF